MNTEQLDSNVEVQRTIQRIWEETNLKITVENYDSLYKILENMYDRAYEWGFDNGNREI